MRTLELADWLGPNCAGPVELRVPADAEQLVLVRAIAHAVAVRERFGADEVTDITVAVDEACTSLIEGSVPGALLTCRLTVSFGTLRVAVSATTSGGGVPSPRSFGWRVLDTITDSVSAWRYESDPQRGTDRVVHIDFAKQFARRPGR
ncbi:ATP-binding protein [Saccharomonospora saliphila]|uniref:ATP-binding protein n=1 Tax=Saccharomonospora saliphila TaxID=369829 RepID=UPI0004918B16|nr:ATP-binding protein [Saccharomonospora saliphila]